MKKNLLAAVLFGTVPFAAMAQSSQVSMYGIMDAAVSREDTGAPNGSKTVLNSGNQSSSRIGFKGTEDLGNDLKAMFNIEAGVALDTGAADSALFGRRAVVGLEGGFGSLTVGREYSPGADVAKMSDILGQGFYGSNLNAFNYLTRRLSNSINYKTPTMGGARLMATYAAGEKNTGPSGDLMGVGAEFKLDALKLGAAYHTIKRLDAGNDKEYVLGAAYKLGNVDIMGGYLVAEPEGGAKFSELNFGASLSMDASTFYANIQQDKLDGGAKGTGFTLAYAYALSKRTNLYASYATKRNNALATFGLNSSSTKVMPPATAPGSDPSALTFGVRHSF